MYLLFLIGFRDTARGAPVPSAYDDPTTVTNWLSEIEAAVVPPAPRRALNWVSEITLSTSISSWLNVAESAVGSTRRMSPGFRFVAVPRLAPNVVMVGSAESTLITVSPAAWAPLI